MEDHLEGIGSHESSSAKIEGIEDHLEGDRQSKSEECAETTVLGPGP